MSLHYIKADTIVETNSTARENLTTDYEEMVESIFEPDKSKKKAIDNFRKDYLQFEKTPEDQRDRKDYAQIEEDLSCIPTFNLNYSQKGLFRGAYCVYYIICVDGLQKTKNILPHDRLVHCSFISHTGKDLIVILRLKKPLIDIILFKSVFQYYAYEFQSKYNLEIMNIDCPTATFYMSMDEYIYINRNATLISTCGD